MYTCFVYVYPCSVDINPLQMNLLGVSMSMIPLDTSMKIGRDIEAFCLGNSWLYNLVPGIRIYLVSPETMDRVCPPERCRAISMDRLGRVRELTSLFLEHPSIENLDRLFRELDSLSSYIKALGCFVARRATDLDVELPAIFIAPERVWEASERIAPRLGIDVEKVFRYVMRSIVSHELSHAVTWSLSDGATYDLYGKEIYVRLLEECVAQLAAYLNQPREDPYTYTMVIDLLSRDTSIEYNLWRTALPYIHTPDLLHIFIHMYTNLVAGKPLRTTILIPLSPPLIPLPLRPRYFLLYYYDVLHLYFASLGPEWHNLFHKIVERSDPRAQQTLAKLLTTSLLTNIAKIYT